jgi:hypothetical protein
VGSLGWRKLRFKVEGCFLLVLGTTRVSGCSTFHRPDFGAGPGNPCAPIVDVSCGPKFRPATFVFYDESPREASLAGGPLPFNHYNKHFLKFTFTHTRTLFSWATQALNKCNFENFGKTMKSWTTSNNLKNHTLSIFSKRSWTPRPSISFGKPGS